MSFCDVFTQGYIKFLVFLKFPALPHYNLDLKYQIFIIFGHFYLITLILSDSIQVKSAKATGVIEQLRSISFRGSSM